MYHSPLGCLSYNYPDNISVAPEWLRPDALRSVISLAKVYLKMAALDFTT